MKTTKKVEATETTLRCDNCGDAYFSCDEEKVKDLDDEMFKDSKDE